MLPVLKYTVLRLALFVAVLGVLAVLRAGPFVAVAGAALVSAMLSYLFLSGQRAQVTALIAERAERRSAQRGPTPSQQDEAYEDALTDAAGQAPGTTSPTPGTTSPTDV